MRRTEAVYRELLCNAMENKNFVFTQSELSKKLNLSLSIVNSAVKKLDSMGAVKIMQRSFRVLDVKKMLYYWASIRNLEKDIIFKTRVEVPVREIERLMPDVVFGAYTAYKLRFNDVPADYSEVYVYADATELENIKRRLSKFKTSISESKRNPNLFILKKDSLMSLYPAMPTAQIFVDLWNIKEWYAKEFINNLEKRIAV